MKRQIILFTSLFIFSFNLTWSYEKSNIRSGYYNEENLNNKEKDKITSLFNEINEDVQNDVEENLDSGKNMLEGDHLFIGQAGEAQDQGLKASELQAPSRQVTASNSDSNTHGSDPNNASDLSRNQGTSRATGEETPKDVPGQSSEAGSGPQEGLQSERQSGSPPESPPGSQPRPQEVTGSEGTPRVPTEGRQDASPSVPQPPSATEPSASEQPQAVSESPSPEGTSPTSRSRRSVESDPSPDNRNNPQTPVSTTPNSNNATASPQTAQPRNNENNRVNRIPEMKYLDLLYDELLTNREGKHQVDFGENHEKYNIFRKEYDNFSINQKEYDIIKKLLNSIFKDNDENEKMKKLANIFQKALIDKEFHDQFKNFIDGILGFAKRHSYLRNEKIQNNTTYKAFFQNAVDLLNTL
ncbi:MSP7-like protein [Plasmodium gaboni]|uniref:MSP7-like protein n=1 Tax=Plasmodium gaboni TaxID=647221 RepID=A0A151L3C8_9APIC|nr:MSP7-like protein [Plasmodium gaboni]KYN93347.1 MSP7-like protein [Plasmodium gaboni]